MDAIVLHGVSDLRYEQVPVPQVQPGAVRVRIGFCGVCGSDIPRCFVRGPTTSRRSAAMSSPARSRRSAKESSSTRSAIGSRPFRVLWREDHPACEQGKYAQSDGYDYLGSRSDGAFSEYVIAPERNLLRVPDNVTLKRAAMTEPASVALHAIRRAGLRLGDTVAIFGLGPIGLMVAQWRGRRGPRTVALFDILPAKLDLARKLGFTHVYDSRTVKPVDATNELTGGRGVHVAIEAAGVRPTMLSALQVAGRAGRVVLLGNPAADVTLPASLISQVMRRETRPLRHVELRLQRLRRRRRLADGARGDGLRHAQPQAADHPPRPPLRGIAALEMMRDQKEFFAKVLIHPEGSE